MRTPRVHKYEDSGTAYDDSQCNDDVKDGDVLVVDGTEKSVAILFEAWPICIIEGWKSDYETRFDCMKPEVTLRDVAIGHLEVDEPYNKYDESIKLDREELAKMTPQGAGFDGLSPYGTW
jgi:hypothetical protein